MKLIKRDTVLDMLLNSGHEGKEINDAFAFLAPASLLNPPWKQDGDGFKPQRVAEYFGDTVAGINKWVKELEGGKS